MFNGIRQVASMCNLHNSIATWPKNYTGKTDPVGKYAECLVFVAKCQQSMLSLAVNNLRQTVRTLTILRLLKVFSHHVHKPEHGQPDRNNKTTLFQQSFPDIIM